MLLKVVATCAQLMRSFRHVEYLIGRYLIECILLEYPILPRHNSLLPPSHPENENLVRTWHFEFQVGKKLAKIPPPLMTYVEGAGVWRLIAVFPKETFSFEIV